MSTEPVKQEKLTIGVLYGFRALMVLFVCNYHIWQQGWLGQYPVLFGVQLDLDFWTRSSYVFVDGMLLLSGFLLYLPYACQREDGSPVPSVKRFYWNRLVRILPSYVVSIAVMLLLFVLPQGAYVTEAAQTKDVLTHLTFTFTFFADTYLFTPINGVLWTVAIEMQFYLIFPLLVKAMRKHAAVTLGLMTIIGVLYRLIVAYRVDSLSMWINQLSAFGDVYALGFLGAIAYVKLQRLTSERRELCTAFSCLTPPIFALGIWLLVELLRTQSANGVVGQQALQLSQLELRLPLAVTLLLLMLSAALWPKWLQKLLDNRLMRFLSAISFNLYLWHQVLSVQIARNLYPDTLHSVRMLQQSFTLLCFSLSILVAMAATYGVEQPAARLANRLRIQYHQHKERIRHERSPYAEAEPSADSVLSGNAQGRASAD